MEILFGNQKKWTLKGFGWFLGALGVLFTIYLDVYLKGTITPLLLFLQLLAILTSVYQGVHNMNKPQKAYVRAHDDHLSIYRSSWTPRERIRYDKIEDYYTVSSLLILQFKSGRESQFDLDLFSKSEVEGIKRLIETMIDK